MAIKHIKFIARELTEKYRKVTELCTGFLERNADVCLSAEDVNLFTAAKTRVESELLFVSVSLSAAVNTQKFKSLESELLAPIKSFEDALNMLLEDMTKEDVPEQTQYLISLYTEKLKSANKAYFVFKDLEVYKNLPTRNKKSCKVLRKLLKSQSKERLEDLCFSQLYDILKTVINPFKLIDEEMKNLEDYVNQDDTIIETAVDDLGE